MAESFVSETEMNIEIARCCWAVRNWQNNKKNIFGNAKQFALLAGTYDSKFHGGENNQAIFMYRNIALTGSDLNYYFQGLIWYAGNQSKAEFFFLLQARKLLWYRKPASANALWAAGLGYDEAPLMIKSFNAGIIR